MNAPTALLTITWLARDTIRQALASGVFYLMLAISAVCILFCLSVQPSGGPTAAPGEKLEILPPNDSEAKDPEKLRKSGVDLRNGEITLGFGLFHTQIGRDKADSVRHQQLMLAGGVADMLGLILALVFTAGFVPTFLEPSAIAVLLAKPVPRWSLLVGKYLGVVAFVFFHAVIFVGGTWMALGLRTGVWEAAYLVCIPLLVLHFAVFYSFSTFLAVCTRNTVACVFGSILFWGLCWGINYGRFMMVTLPDLDAMTPLMKGLVEGSYWILPKPFDQTMMLLDSLQAGNFFPEAKMHAEKYAPSFSPEMSILSALGFGVLMLVSSARQFVKTDY
jgi:ABC-type transport system involved in multi-copper enzyme maturation permease subunit